MRDGAEGVIGKSALDEEIDQLKRQLDELNSQLTPETNVHEAARINDQVLDIEEIIRQKESQKSEGEKEESPYLEETQPQENDGEDLIDPMAVIEAQNKRDQEIDEFIQATEHSNWENKSLPELQEIISNIRSWQQQVRNAEQVVQLKKLIDEATYLEDLQLGKDPKEAEKRYRLQQFIEKPVGPNTDVLGKLDIPVETAIAKEVKNEASSEVPGEEGEKKPGEAKPARPVIKRPRRVYGQNKKDKAEVVDANTTKRERDELTTKIDSQLGISVETLDDAELQKTFKNLKAEYRKISDQKDPEKKKEFERKINNLAAYIRMKETPTFETPTLSEAREGEGVTIPEHPQTPAEAAIDGADVPPQVQPAETPEATPEIPKRKRIMLSSFEKDGDLYAVYEGPDGKPGSPEIVGKMKEEEKAPENQPESVDKPKVESAPEKKKAKERKPRNSKKKSEEIPQPKPESEDKKEIAEVEKELEQLPPEERKEIEFGLQTMGYIYEENKNKFFANAFDKAAQANKNEGGWLKRLFKKGSAVTRWAESARDKYRSDQDLAHRKAIELKPGKWKGIKSTTVLAGDIVKTGRIIADFTGISMFNPLRWVMLGSKIFSEVTDISKEARLRNEEVLEKTRIEDKNDAYNKAWEIYENARKGKDGNVSKEELKEAYLRDLPRDILDRLAKPEPNKLSFFENVVQGDLIKTLGKFEDRVENIQRNRRLSKEEKEAEINNLYAKYQKNLLDYDRIISQAGTYDGLALALKYANFTGKTISNVVAIETLAIGIDKAAEGIANLIHKFGENHEAIANVGSGAAEYALKQQHALEAMAPTGPDDYEVIHKGSYVSDTINKMVEKGILTAKEAHEARNNPLSGGIIGDHFSPLDKTGLTVEGNEIHVIREPGKAVRFLVTKGGGGEFGTDRELLHAYEQVHKPAPDWLVKSVEKGWDDTIPNGLETTHVHSDLIDSSDSLNGSADSLSHAKNVADSVSTAEGMGEASDHFSTGEKVGMVAGAAALGMYGYSKFSRKNSQEKEADQNKGSRKEGLSPNRNEKINEDSRKELQEVLVSMLSNNPSAKITRFDVEPTKNADKWNITMEIKSGLRNTIRFKGSINNSKNSVEIKPTYFEPSDSLKIKELKKNFPEELKKYFEKKSKKKVGKIQITPTDFVVETQQIV